MPDESKPPRQEIQFIGAMHRAAPLLHGAWWILLVARGVMPPLFAVATGVLVGAVTSGASLAGPLILVGLVFVVFQVLAPVHQAVSANLGNRTANWLNDELMDACLSPPGQAHLEDPELVNDLMMARNFDLGLSGPPLSISMDFIASGLVLLVSGLASVAVMARFTWWAPLVLLAAWGSTQWFLRESAVWKDRNTDEVRDAQRHADYAYRLAVDAPAAKEVRLFGLSPWVVDRFATKRRHLFELQWEATRLRERSLLSSAAVVIAGVGLVFWRLADAAIDGSLGLGEVVVYLQAAIGTSAVAFGGLSWALDGAAAPVAAVRRLRAAMAPIGALPEGDRPATGLPVAEIRFRDVSFGYRGADGAAGRLVLDGLDLTIPAGTSMAIVGVNGAGKTTLAKLLCRLYDPVSGAIEVDGTDLRHIEIGAWRSRVVAVFQDFIRYQLSLADNVAPLGAPLDDIEAALADARASGLASPGTILAKGFEGGTELSGGQWQRVALARALCGIRLGAGVVLLDEPTAQLDVRGEAEIFDRLIESTSGCTTILVSHRFSTVRKADRICVLEHGRAVELGNHDELMALGGRYHEMFTLQASRFVELDESGEEVTYEPLG